MRSYNNAKFSISQLTKDALHDVDKGNFGVAFAFDEPSEREDVLKWMNLEPSIENQKMLGSMFQGQCLFKDIYGRNSKISIECLLKSGWVLSRPSIKVKWHMLKRCICCFVDVFIFA
ncbi:ATP-binding protein [Bacillus safensis]|nr:ATP-binding protein [Bacillus safensis]